MSFRATWFGCVLLLVSGCSSWNVLGVRSQSPDESAGKSQAAQLVGDMAVPFGMHPVRVEGVTLVTGLRGTGSDPAPSPYRAAILTEMQRRGVDQPNAVLASSDTALVLVRGVLRPGIQKGDHFDIELRIPSRSETTSLRGGYLLETRLRELAVLNNEVHDGHLLALAKGPVMVDPGADGDDNAVRQCRGRVLGGGVALKSRPLGLVLKPGFQNVFNSSRVANAVNKRFHSFRHGIKEGVATATTDQYIELNVSPRYKDNIERYVRVVRAVGLRDSATARRRRLGELKHRLLSPDTASKAALELESIGKQGVKPLHEAIKSPDPEVRFFAAEALAYLDESDAAEPLGEAARDNPAFRVFALTALSAMDDYRAYEQLRELLEVPSVETRYGAFRALWRMRSDDPVVAGENLGDQFSYHVLDTSGTPLIHVTRNRRPEVVLFGRDQRLVTPLAVNAGNLIMVTGTSGEDQITVSRYAVNELDQKRVVSTSLDEVIRAIVELGGTYPDVVQALQEAQTVGALLSRFEVDALPEAGRIYERQVASGAEKSDSTSSEGTSKNPLAGLFTKKNETAPSPSTKDTDEKEPEKSAASSPSSPPLTGLLGKITGRTPR